MNANLGSLGQHPLQRFGWVLYIVFVVAAVELMIPGAIGNYRRTYESWSSTALEALARGQDAGPSRLAPVEWLGRKPFVVRSNGLQRGTRVELRLRTTSGRSVADAFVDEHRVARFDVDGVWRTYRVWIERKGSVLRLEEPGGVSVPIHMARIKITNVLGFSEGLLNGWIVRREAPFRSAPWSSRLLLFLVVLASGFLAEVRPHSGDGSILPTAVRCARWVVASAMALAAARLLAAILGYRLVVTTGTAVVILLLPELVMIAGRAAGRLRLEHLRHLARSRHTWEVLVLAGALAIWATALLVLVQGPFCGDLRGVARFGWKFPNPPWLQDVPELSRAGYDGQFYAVLASDPLLRRPATRRAIDNPGYRSTRILIPLLAWISVAGSSRAAPYAYVVWCWVLGLAGPLLLLLWYRRSRGRIAWGVLLCFNGGLVVSMLRATPDAGALAIMFGALYLAELGTSSGLTATGGALAVLARETSLLAVPGLAWPQVKAGRWRSTLVVVATPALAFALWRLHVRVTIHRGFGSAWTNFGVPLGWVLPKLRRLSGLAWGHRAALEWMGVAWVVLFLTIAASYIFWRRRLTPMLIAFLAFAALAAAVNMRVYAEVNAFARVLIALPLLGAALVRDEPFPWRRVALTVAVLLASVQGGLLLRWESQSAWHQLRHQRQADRGAGAGVRVLGATAPPGSRWHVAKDHRVVLVARDAPVHVPLRILSGQLSVRRFGRDVVTLQANQSITLMVGAAGRALELRGISPHGATVGALSVASTPRIKGHTALVPIIVGSGGYDGGRWETDLILDNDTAKLMNIDLCYVDRDGGLATPYWAHVELPARSGMTLHDVVPGVYGVRGAGFLRVVSQDALPEIRCRIAHRDRHGTSLAFAPVLPAKVVRELTASPWRVTVPLKDRDVRISVVLVNPFEKTMNVRLGLRFEPGSSGTTRSLVLGPYQWKQLTIPVGSATRRVQVFVSNPAGAFPIGVVTVTRQDSAAFDLYCPEVNRG